MLLTRTQNQPNYYQSIPKNRMKYNGKKKKDSSKVKFLSTLKLMKDLALDWRSNIFNFWFYIELLLLLSSFINVYQSSIYIFLICFVFVVTENPFSKMKYLFKVFGGDRWCQTRGTWLKEKKPQKTKHKTQNNRTVDVGQLILISDNCSNSKILHITRKGWWCPLG